MNHLESTKFQRFKYVLNLVRDQEVGADIRLQIQVSRKSIPCSFPDRSLFRFGLKTHFPPSRYCTTYGYLRLGSIKEAKFPVFFPVSRDLGWRKVRTGLRPPPASLGS